ncbi:hypothetical protein CPB85DRAFT_1342550 [Mucidula mucida]|nr:hypothetical protein CPB85DRAFT_1342550 [Mucidula mucida]
MEAVGLAASIIALLGVAKKLSDVVGSSWSAESTVVVKRIVLDLTAVHECLQQSFDSIDACRDLHEACADLESSLTACLSACRDLSESRFVHRFKALLRGRTKADIVLDLRRLNSMSQRSFCDSWYVVQSDYWVLIQVLSCLDEGSCSHRGLDSIESHLKFNDKANLLGDSTARGAKDLRKPYDLRTEIRRLRHAFREFSPVDQKRKGHDDRETDDDDELEDGTPPYQSDILSMNQELTALPVRYT